MNLKIFIVLVSISTALSQEFLVELKFSLREEKVPAIINYLLNNSLEVHEITTSDIIKLSKLDKYDLEATLQVFNFFNITSEQVFTVDNLEKLLDSLNVRFLDFYNNFTTNLQLTNEQIINVLGKLSVDPVRFFMAMTSSDKTEVYEVLRKGVYDQTTANAAFESAGKTGAEVYATARNLVVVEAEKLSSSEFMNLLKTRGFNQRLALNVYKALNITTRDVYAVEKFKQIFVNITDGLNQNLTLGVFVGPQKLAVHKVSFEQFSRHVDGVTVKIEANGVEVSAEKTANLGLDIVELASTQTGPGYIEVIQFYNATGTCTYTTISNGQVREEKVEVDGWTVKKNERVVFALGSPLVCDGKLYGLAGAETESEITIDGFFTEDNPEPVTEASDLENRGFTSSPMMFVLVFNIVGFAIL